MKATSTSHPHLQCAKINDTLWGLYTLQLTKAYSQSSNKRVKTLVTCIGRQPNSDVWVFSPSVQVDSEGLEIPLDQQQYYWYVYILINQLMLIIKLIASCFIVQVNLYLCHLTDCTPALPLSISPNLPCRHTQYMSCCTSTCPVPLPITLPLEIQPLVELLYLSRRCLDNNFISSFLVLAGGVIVFHYETILDIQDECPLNLCYSSKSGTGTVLTNYFVNRLRESLTN